MPKLSEELAIAHGSGGYARWLAQLAKTDIVILDDQAMTPLTDSARRDLLEVLEDRHMAIVQAGDIAVPGRPLA